MEPELGQTTKNLRFSDLVKLSTRIFKVKPTRTFLTIFGTSIGIATVVFLISLGYGLQYLLIGKMITTQDSLFTLQASYPSESGLGVLNRQIDEIAKLPNVKEVSKSAEFSGEIKSAENTGLIIVRVVPSNYFRLSGLIPDMGRQSEEGKPEVVLTSEAAKLLGLPSDPNILDKDVEVSVFYQETEDSTPVVAQAKAPLSVVGLINSDMEPPLVMISEGQFEEQPPHYKEIFVKADKIDNIEGLRDQLIGKGFVISSRLDLVNQANKILNIFTIVLGVFGVAALTVSAVGMFNTMIVSFMERVYEVGIMKSLGATDRDVRNIFLMESFLMGLAGGVAGVLLGMGSCTFFNILLNFFSKRLGGPPFDLFITPLWFIATIIGSAGFIGLFAGFWPARKAIMLSPKEAFVRK